MKITKAMIKNNNKAFIVDVLLSPNFENIACAKVEGMGTIDIDYLLYDTVDRFNSEVFRRGIERAHDLGSQRKQEELKKVLGL